MVKTCRNWDIEVVVVVKKEGISFKVVKVLELKRITNLEEFVRKQRM
jgi:hypothetical protein